MRYGVIVTIGTANYLQVHYAGEPRAVSVERRRLIGNGEYGDIVRGRTCRAASLEMFKELALFEPKLLLFYADNFRADPRLADLARAAGGLSECTELLYRLSRHENVDIRLGAVEGLARQKYCLDQHLRDIASSDPSFAVQKAAGDACAD